MFFLFHKVSPVIGPPVPSVLTGNNNYCTDWFVLFPPIWDSNGKVKPNQTWENGSFVVPGPGMLPLTPGIPGFFKELLAFSSNLREAVQLSHPAHILTGMHFLEKKELTFEKHIFINCSICWVSS